MVLIGIAAGVSVMRGVGVGLGIGVFVGVGVGSDVAASADVCAEVTYGSGVTMGLEVAVAAPLQAAASNASHITAAASVRFCVIPVPGMHLPVLGLAAPARAQSRLSGPRSLLMDGLSIASLGSAGSLLYGSQSVDLAVAIGKDVKILVQVLPEG